MLKKSSILWTIAIILTLVFIIYQRKTGPTYPVKGEKQINGSVVSYKFLRSYTVGKDVPVKISSTVQNLDIYFVHKRLMSDDDWSAKIPMKYNDGVYTGMLPALDEMAGKRVYKVYVNGEMITDDPIVIRFKGDVPAYVLIPHILLMFIAMLYSTRAGFEALFRNQNTYRYTLITTFSLLVGGIILGPIVQKFAFDAYWTGWPFGHDLTDNKTLAAMICWAIAWWKVRRNPTHKTWVIIAFAVLTIVYLIPHSMLGSEFDYSQME